MQPLAGTGQAGHERMPGNPDDRRDFLVRQTFQLAEDHHLPELHGQYTTPSRTDC